VNIPQGVGPNVFAPNGKFKPTTIKIGNVFLEVSLPKKMNS
jgi:hypothetical protein